jgi:type IV pilus assembly protein PilX
LQSLVRLPPPTGGAGGDHGHGNDGDEGRGDGNDDAHGGGSGNGSGDRPPARPQERPLPVGRIGWREIANWDELHANAGP